MSNWRGSAQIFGALLLLQITGCIRLSAARDYPGPAPLPTEIRDSLDSHGELGATLIKTRVLETSEQRYRILRAKLKPNVNLLNDHELIVDLYEIFEGEEEYGTSQRPLIVVLPILGGGNEVANHFARVFARKGFACAIVHRQEEYKDAEQSTDELNLIFEQIILDHEQALDWIVEQPGVDPTRVGLFGVSAGGIKGSLVYATDPRIKAAVFALVGGDLAYVLTHSREDGLIEKRDRIMELHNVSRDELEEIIQRDFRFDPLDYAPYMDARNVLMVLALFDAVVPYSTGKRLREAMGNPETILIPTGHYGALLYVPMLEWEAVAWFNRHLGLHDRNHSRGSRDAEDE